MAGFFVYPYKLGIFPIGLLQSLGLLPEVRLGRTGLKMNASSKD
jgi:hypothetical protein